MEYVHCICIIVSLMDKNDNYKMASVIIRLSSTVSIILIVIAQKFYADTPRKVMVLMLLQMHIKVRVTLGMGNKFLPETQTSLTINSP